MTGDSEEGAADHIQAEKEGPERAYNEGAVARTTSTTTMLSNPITSTLSSSRRWSAFRNPRIVRVSKAFGGKDRHSKVCTIRGLRDRRIRLSVPTAAQLYDLQDKLGLGQPSKVIDWLLDASKEDIEELPSLRLPQGFGHHHFNPQLMLLPSFQETGSGFLKDGTLGHGPFLARRHGINVKESFACVDHHEGESNSPRDRVGYDSLTYSTHLHLGDCRMTQGQDSSKGKWVEINEGHSYGAAADCSNPSDSSHQAPVSAQNFFPVVGYSLSGLLPVNPLLPCGHSTQWEPTSMSLSHFGSHGLQFQPENHLGSNTVMVSAPHASSSSSSSSSTSGLPRNPQLYFCSPAAATPLFPSHPQQVGHHVQTPSLLMPTGLRLIGSTTKPSQTKSNATRVFPPGGS